MIPLPASVAGVPFARDTAAGRVAGYRLGEGRTVLLLHSFNAAGAGIELAPLASRLAEHRRVVLVDWLGFGTSARPDAPYGWALYGEQLERIREGAQQPGESAVDVVPQTAIWNGSRSIRPGISPSSSGRTRRRP